MKVSRLLSWGPPNEAVIKKKLNQNGQYVISNQNIIKIFCLLLNPSINLYKTKNILKT